MSQDANEQLLQVALQQHQAGRLEQAERLYRRILAQQPNHADAWHFLGVIAYQTGGHDRAVNLIRQAIGLRPSYPEAYTNLGLALQANGQLGEAAAAYRQAIVLKGDYPEAHFMLGAFLQATGRLDEAMAAYRQAIALNPNYPLAYNNLGGLLKDKGQLDEAMVAFRQAMTLKPNFPEAHSNLIYTMHLSPACDARAIAEELRRWSVQYAEPLRHFMRPHLNDRHAERRLRIGYVSADFREHAVAANLLRPLGAHDHGNFEIFFYAGVRRPDAVTQRFVAMADVWRVTTGLSDERLAEQIREDRIDILVDLSVHTADNRLLVFARKPAPVQVTFAGYPGSTGLSTVDYRLTDAYLDPPACNDAFYTEQSVYLPDCFWCYDPLGAEARVNGLPAEGNGRVTFGCLNKFRKVNDGVLALWARVLKAVPEAHLIMLSHAGSHRRRTLERLEEDGVDPARVQFVPWQPRPHYLEVYHRIDVGLDTVPYNGHTTSLDSFWMGVPVVTLVGPTAVSRAGLCQLMNLGLPELVANHPDDYVRIAAELASDLPRLSHLRATLRRRMEQSPLMEGPRFCRNLEAAYRQMWRRWCASLV